ncbi:variant erythrocyte surface antigen-1 family protein [Babesia caballi]|uniref:Variant erythrocyte surface antigen-1 family protein n=1 Tax=Babesia caballi TaxID=5871 RepID=A0AAV4LRW0_BABCB|nr:variant erythrocyte surface antigen-1 family protein [Babesia caballi]
MPPLDISFILHSRPLTGSHSNLKEAIDWILRVTGKDGQDSSGGGTQELASAVSILLASVKSSSPELDSNFQKIKGALISSGNNGLIDNLATGLAKFIGYENGGGNIGKGGIAVGKGGTTGEPWKPAENRKGAKGYVYSYDPAEANWKSDGTIEQICAKIFLGCLPMIFSALSYLYWRCHENGGGWKGYRFKGDGPIKTFMVGNGYKVSELNDGMMGSHITYSAMTHSNFKDFKEGMDKAALTAKERAEKEKEAWRKIYPNTSSQSNFNPKPTYPEFLTELQKNGQDKFPQIFSNVQNDSLSILFHISKLYFNAKHFAISKLPDFKPKSPSTIREMLYFLAALPYSPNYGALGTYISDHFKSLVDNSGVKEDYELMIPVADSATNQKHNTLSAANLKDYLTKSSCLSITVLGIIQGHGASENPVCRHLQSRVWLEGL